MRVPLAMEIFASYQLSFRCGFCTSLL